MGLPSGPIFLRNSSVASMVATMIQTLLSARNRPTQTLSPEKGLVRIQNRD